MTTYINMKLKAIVLPSLIGLATITLPSPALARFEAPKKLISESGATYLLLQENHGAHVPNDVHYVYKGKVREPGTGKLYEREYWFKGGRNYMMTGSFVEKGHGETCYATAGFMVKNYHMGFKYLPRHEGNQNCSLAGQTFSTQLINKSSDIAEERFTPYPTSSTTSYPTATIEVGRATAYITSERSNAAFSIPEGAQVEVLDEAADGPTIVFKVRYQGRTGWVPKYHLDY